MASQDEVGVADMEGWDVEENWGDVQPEAEEEAPPDPADLPWQCTLIAVTEMGVTSGRSKHYTGTCVACGVTFNRANTSRCLAHFGVSP